MITVECGLPISAALTPTTTTVEKKIDVIDDSRYNDVVSEIMEGILALDMVVRFMCLKYMHYNR